MEAIVTLVYFILLFIVFFIINFKAKKTTEVYLKYNLYKILRNILFTPLVFQLIYIFISMFIPRASSDLFHKSDQVGLLAALSMILFSEMIVMLLPVISVPWIVMIILSIRKMDKISKEEFQIRISDIKVNCEEEKPNATDLKKYKVKFFLCLFGGWSGIHKFMENKVLWGFIYLFTFGLYWIGWLVDIVLTLIDWLDCRKKAKKV